jgi:hypothetical protein
MQRDIVKDEDGEATCMTMDEYRHVADAYYRISGEHLMADADYVLPLWNSSAVAVDVDPAIEPPFERHDAILETAERTAAMILVSTYGLKSLASMSVAAILAQG